MKDKLLTAVVSSTLVLSFACQKKEEAQTTTQSAKQQVETTQPSVEEKPAENVQENQQQAKEEVNENAKEINNQQEEIVEEVQEKKTTQEETANQPKIDGQQIFQSKGCTACHNPSADTVGPSLKKISTVYKGKKEELIAFFKGEHPAIVDPAKAAIMQPQINTTKVLSEEELEALADYILSF